jgi:ABC-type branched-subunit amino acid transport system substrate-binding protein
MTFGMKVRLWAREAPRSHVIGTSVAVVALVVVLVAAVLPASDDDGTVTSTLAPSVVASGATPVSVATTPSGDPSAPAAAGTPSGAPSAATAAAGASSGGATPSASAASGAAPASATPVELTASDQGVTPETIKVGFLIADTGGLGAAGNVALETRTDMPEVIKAFVDHVNANGGVRGRALEHVTASSDPVNASSQQAACIKLTTDEKVFAVFDTASTLGVAQNCYAQKGVILTTTASQTNSEQNFQRNGGLLASSGASQNRVLLNWADLALAGGFIGPGKGKLGILSTECAPDPEAIDGDFKPYLKQHGVDYVDVRLSCDLATAQQQVGGAVLQFRQAGVDRVLPSAIFVTVNNYLQAAEAQQYRPTYYCSDMWGLCLDIFTRNFPVAQWDGTRGFTFSHSGEDKAGAPLSPAVQRCSQILTDAGVPGITEQMGKDAAAVATCDSFFLWVTAMANAPDNPRRADFPGALAAIGDRWESPYANRAVFGPTKFNGGDDAAPVQWLGDCTCHTQTGPRVAVAH